MTPRKTRPIITFYRRLGSSVFLWLSVLWTLFSSQRGLADPILGILVVIMVGMGLKEYFQILDAQETPHFGWFGISAGCVLTALEFLRGSAVIPGFATPESVRLLLGVSGIYVLLLCGVFSHRDFKRGLVAISVTVFGILYVSLLFNFMLRIFYHPQLNGQLLVFYLILVTKSSDAGAYLVGSWLGRSPMVPDISPGKTWEGFAGALIIPMIFSVAVCLISPDGIGGIGPLAAAVMGILFGCGAVVGDLIESIFKRQSGVKDSGRIFPGIGGMLDLLDSLLFNAPILYFLVEFLLAGRAAN